LKEAAAAPQCGGAGGRVIQGPLVPGIGFGEITGWSGGLAAAALRWDGAGRHW
jgi:hypothetical protein